MALPQMVVTGASGFVGRHLLDTLKEHYRIFGIARRSQSRSGAPVHPNITWFQADVGDREALERAFREIRAAGGAEVAIHLAAHYDFTGDESPEYMRTNVHGTRNVLDSCKDLGLRRFFFSSSVAASQFPPRGGALDEKSPPDGDHIYAQTKRMGEEMLAEYRDYFPSNVVRFAALFSDWCEYPPLFVFLSTWLSRSWNARVLGGKGLSAIPYLHVDDVAMFFVLLLVQLDDIPPGEVLVVSPDRTHSHRELFESASLLYFGRRRKSILMPKLLCGPGMLARDLMGRLLGERPFERPWMARYIDLDMAVDASRTRDLVSWEPRPRLEILRRLPFLIEHIKTDPLEWHERNRAAMEKVDVRRNLRIHQLLERHEKAISKEFTDSLMNPRGRRHFPSYQSLSPDEHRWNHRMILRQMMNAVRTREKAVLVSYCRDLAERRYEQGFHAEEVCGALQEMNRICFKMLRRDPESDGLQRDLQDHITTTLRFAADQVEEVFELLEGHAWDRARPAGEETPEASVSAE